MTDSPFPKPTMVCKGCGKDAETHHPTYCHPVTDRLFLAFLIVGAVCFWVTVAALWVRG